MRRLRLLLRRYTQLLRHRRSTGYYVALFSMVGLAFGIGTAVITGQGILEGDPQLAEAVHNDAAIVVHTDGGEHYQTPLGNLLFGRRAVAHQRPWCGHGTIWPTIGGVLHKYKFLRHASGGDHIVGHWHYRWTGTGYTKVQGSKRTYRFDC